MANNLVVQLLLKTGTFSTDLKTARGQVQNFQKGCQTAGKSLDAFGKAIGIDIGALTKFGGAVGIAVAAGKGLKAVIDSNQTSADKFQEVMYSAKTAVNELAYAIGTFDFTNFNDGLTGLINRARKAAQEIDQLGDTIRGYNVLEAEAQAAIAHARAVGRDKNATKEQKEAANAAARAAVEAARDGAKEAADQYVATLGAELRAKGAQVDDEEVFGLVKKAVVINAQAGRDAGKARASAEYEEYQKKMSSLNREFGGEAQTFSTNYGTFGYNNDAYKQNPEYQRRLKDLTEQYKESIVFNAVLVKQTDKQQEHTANMLTSVYRLNEMVDTMDSRLEGIENKTNGSTDATQKGTEAIKESLSYWQKIAQEAQKNRDASVYMSDAWKDANSKLDEALRKIELITAAMERAKTESKYGTDILTPITGPNLTGQAVNTKPSGLAGEESKKTIADIDRQLEALEKKRKDADDATLAVLNQRIDALNKEKEAKLKLGIDTPGPSSKTINSWEMLGDVLGDVSNIASRLSDVLGEVLDEDTMDRWNKFFRWIRTGVAAFQLISSVIQTATRLQEMFGKVTQDSAAENAAAQTAEATATVAAKEAEAQAAATAAGAKGADAVAGIPVVGPALAVAAVAAIVAAIIATSAKVKGMKFANGGIVGGNSFYGDRVVANVNSGEMILNKNQQARLFQMANSGGTGGMVEFHISGTDLVGVLNNQTRKNKLIR